MNLSLAASVHCFIVCIGRLLRPWNSILISHRPALRVGKSSAKAGAADSKIAAITARRRMACTPSQMRCAIITWRWNEESARLDGDQIVVARPAAMNRERTAKYLLDGVEAVDQRKIFGHFAVAEAQEVRQPVADDAAILGAPAPQAIQSRDLVAVNQHRARHEAEHLETFRHQPADQIEHRRLAVAGAAERQHVDRPADSPFHVVVEEWRDPVDVTGDIGREKGVDDGARDRLDGRWALHDPSQRWLC